MVCLDILFSLFCIIGIVSFQKVVSFQAGSMFSLLIKFVLVLITAGLLERVFLVAQVGGLGFKGFSFVLSSLKFAKPFAFIQSWSFDRIYPVFCRMFCWFTSYSKS